MHKSQDDLIKELTKAYTKVKIDGLYYHYKDPNRMYKVLTLGVLESDDSLSVIYEAQYGDKLVFVRPLSGWLDKVEQNGEVTDRFTFVRQM